MAEYISPTVEAFPDNGRTWMVDWLGDVLYLSYLRYKTPFVRWHNSLRENKMTRAGKSIEKRNHSASRVLMVVGGATVAIAELFFALAFHSLSSKEVSVFEFAQGIAIGFSMLLSGHVTRLEAKIADLEQRLIRKSASETNPS